MYGFKALYLLLALKYSSNSNTVIAKAEIAARFPTNPNANFISEADTSHRMLVESSYTQVGDSFHGDSGDLIGFRGVVISDDGLIIAFSSCKYFFFTAYNKINMNKPLLFVQYSDIGMYVDVYEYNGFTWVRKGSRISSNVDNDYFGSGLDLSSDGLTIVIGAYQYTSDDIVSI